MTALRLKTAHVITLLSCTLWTPMSFAVPLTVPYIGRLSEDGKPANKRVNAYFELFENAIGGEPLWQEAHDGVDVHDGLFYAQLGAGAGLDVTTIFTGAPRWLQVTIDDQPLSPRVRLPSVPYALRASVCDNVVGNITPRSIEVNGVPVIDEMGTWVGKVASPMQGVPGKSALVQSSPIASDATCATGGVKLEIGLDENGNRTMDPGEVLSTANICHGAKGPKGDKGDTGPRGPAGPTKPLVCSTAETRAASIPTLTKDNTGLAAATCPKGTKVTGGGCIARGGRKIYIYESRSATGYQGWLCRGLSVDSNHIMLIAHATCCTI